MIFWGFTNKVESNRILQGYGENLLDKEEEWHRRGDPEKVENH